jgi:4-oxalocrotonate tautomerase
MPVLHLRTSPLSGPAQARDLARAVCELSTRLLGKKLPVSACLVEELPASHWFVAGEPVKGATAFLEVHISAGTNTSEEKAAFVREAFAELDRQLGGLTEVSYVIVHEVPKPDWGYGGRTQASRQAVAL